MQHLALRHFLSLRAKQSAADHILHSTIRLDVQMGICSIIRYAIPCPLI